MKSKKLSIFVVAMATLGLVSASQTAASPAAIVDEDWIPKKPQGVLGRQAITMMDQADYMEMASVLRGYPNRSDGTWKSCSSLADANCQGVEVIEFGAILQRCESATSLNCIAEFGVVRSDGTKVPATFERSFPAEAFNKYPADDAKSLPVGGPGSLWNVPASEGMTNPLHYVRVSLIGSARPGESFEFKNFAATVTPVSMTTKNCEDTVSWSTDPNPCTAGDYANNPRNKPGYSGFVVNLGDDAGLDCIMTGNPNRTTKKAECALRRAAPLTQSYYLTVRLSQSPQGWLHGRLADAQVSITSIDGVKGAITLAMQGKPVRVPVVFKEMAFADLPDSLKTVYAKTGGWPSSTGGSGYYNNWGLQDVDATDGTKRNRNSSPPSYGADGIAELEAWMPTMNDTSTADRSTWSVRTLSSWERGQANSCLTDKTRVTGLVLTNATQYLAGAPAYNKQTQSLDYKVSAPHKMSNGEVFKGSYELLMPSDIAQCVYGFKGVAMKASIEVVESEAGQASTATYSVSETNGWFRLVAAGYTHSSPTIRAKFTETATTGSSTTSAAPTVKAKKSLSRSALVKAAGLKVSKKSKVALTVAKRSAKVCRVQAGALRGLKKGKCSVTVTVTTGKKRAKKTLTVSVT